MTGIGGFFFRATDPKALRAWYATRLGLEEKDWVWHQEAGPTVFAPFPRDTDHFARDRAFMLNLRVTDLDALLATLRAAGVAFETRAEWDTPETGRFARLHDPEGNPLELWEPPAE